MTGSTTLSRPLVGLERKGRPPQDPVAAKGREDAARSGDEADRESVRCATCGHDLAEPNDRIEVGGSFAHVFMNPAGLVFEISLYARARGVVARGERSSDWSWFPGTSWTVGLCGECAAHLGWIFDGASTSFVGLIADRIVER